MSTNDSHVSAATFKWTFDSVQSAGLDFSAYHVPVKGIELIKQFTDCHLTSFLTGSLTGSLTGHPYPSSDSTSERSLYVAWLGLFLS